MFARKVTLLLCVALLVVSAGCTMWGEKKKASWSNVTGGEQLDRLFWQDVKAKNWKSVEARMAPMLVWTSASGVMGRAAALEHLKSLGVQEFQIGEVDTKPAGADLVVSYVITIRKTSEGDRPAETPVRVMSVWQELSKGWVLIARSEVPIAP